MIAQGLHGYIWWDKNLMLNSLLPNFFTLIETQFQKVIKSFRSDNAQELKFIDYFNKERVIHQFSCVERPVQNSVVERKHQHFINVAHALLFQSRVPIQFWGDCVLRATYLINRTPSPLLQNKTPFVCLYNSQVNYDYPKTFGYICYASTLPSHRTKFHPRAKALYSLVIFQLSKDTNSLTLSLFHEHIFFF